MHFRQDRTANTSIGRGHSRSWFIMLEVRPALPLPARRPAHLHPAPQDWVMTCCKMQGQWPCTSVDRKSGSRCRDGLARRGAASEIRRGAPQRGGCTARMSYPLGDSEPRIPGGQGGVGVEGRRAARWAGAPCLVSSPLPRVYLYYYIKRTWAWFCIPRILCFPTSFARRGCGSALKASMCERLLPISSLWCQLQGSGAWSSVGNFLPLARTSLNPLLRNDY